MTSAPLPRGASPGTSVARSSATQIAEIDPDLPAGIVARAHPPTMADSFDALFAPVDALVAPTAFAVHLLDLVRPLLDPDPGVAYAEYARRYPTGLQFRVELHGHGRLGLPTVYDYDVLFAVFELAVERGANEHGVIDGVTFWDIATKLGYSAADYGGSRHAAIKTALARWAALSVATNLDLAAPRDAQAARDGRARLATPDAYPRRVLPQVRWYSVVKYGIDRQESTSEDETEVRMEWLRSIQIEPLWLAHVAKGYTAWIDRELHASVRSPYAKRLLELLSVRALRVPTWAAHEPWTVRVVDLLEEMGVKSATQAGRTRGHVVRAIEALAEAGVVGRWVDRPGRGAQHQVELTPGERLLAMRSSAGLRAGESPESARLVWALMHGPWAFSVHEARHYVETNAATVHRVLEYAVYLHERGWSPRKSWSAWMAEAIRRGFRFEGDTRFRTYRALRRAGYTIPATVEPRDAVRLTAPAFAVHARADAVASAANPEPGDVLPPVPSETFEDTVWGRTRQRLAADPSVIGYASWIRPLVAERLPTPSEPRLMLVTPDRFAMDWIGRKLLPRISETVSAEAGTPIEVHLEVAANVGDDDQQLLVAAG